MAVANEENRMVLKQMHEEPGDPCVSHVGATEIAIRQDHVVRGVKIDGSVQVHDSREIATQR
jgi:hypothetical protein